MSLRINDEAPYFTAQTTQGEINFHEWYGLAAGVDRVSSADNSPDGQSCYKQSCQSDKKFSRRVHQYAGNDALCGMLTAESY